MISVLLSLCLLFFLSLGEQTKALGATIRISSQNFALTVNHYKTLRITGTSRKVTWSSGNKKVATVSSKGRVTAIAHGMTTIYASVSGKKLSCTIKVLKSSRPVETAITSLATSDDQTDKIIGYYASWSRYSGFTPDKIDALKLTHVHYAFANIDSNLKITLGYPDIDFLNIKALNDLKLKNPKLKTIISVGGYSWSGRFSDVAMTEASRAIFADSCVDFIVKYGFDGIDIDWEYPVVGGLSTNIRRPDDKYNLTLLMKTLREKLDARGAIDGKKYILSFAGAAGSWYLNQIELNKISQYIDYVNVMTYDLHGPWEPYTNFNAPLYSDDPLRPGNISVDRSINCWLNTGISKSKIIVGVPFYGFIYKGVPNVNYGFNQTYSGGASISYKNIAANYLNAVGFKSYYNTYSRVPWLFDGSTFITYENEQSMAEKARYIKNQGLGGIMIWELSQDPNKILLNSLYDKMK